MDLRLTSLARWSTRGYPNEELPRRWVGRCADEYLAVLHGLLDLPISRSVISSFGGTVKTVFTCHHTRQLQERITAAFMMASRGMLARVWAKLDCRIPYVCPVTKGALRWPEWRTICEGMTKTPHSLCLFQVSFTTLFTLLFKYIFLNFGESFMFGL